MILYNVFDELVYNLFTKLIDLAPLEIIGAPLCIKI